MINFNHSLYLILNKSYLYKNSHIFAIINNENFDLIINYYFFKF